MIFSPNSKRLFSGSGAKTVRSWIFLDELVEIGCQMVRRNLTRAEWEQYLPGAAYRPTCPNLPANPD